MCDMRRREFITLLGGAAVAWPLAASAALASEASGQRDDSKMRAPDTRPEPGSSARAPPQPTPALIGVLNGSSAAALVPQLEAFRGALRGLGYVEGTQVRFEYRFADGKIDRLGGLAAELVRLKPSVIVSAPVPANLAARRATDTIPIVMASGADPVGFGLVETLARPGGNVTGLTNFAEELASKQIDVMRELLPHLARLAALVNVGNPLHVPQWRETQAAAAQANLALVPFELHDADQLEAAFAAFVREKADALLVPPDVTFTTHRRRIADLAAAARLPAIYFIRQSVEDGGLMSYGPNPVENYRRAATYVDRILKGAKPGDLPIERPTKIELVINLKTAKAL
ncbi:MAG TPA: ABC transporter substrate-binding protein, partial [Xanthobacteraceae bacterium]